jgi:hypothetical protein
MTAGDAIRRTIATYVAFPDDMPEELWTAEYGSWDCHYPRRPPRGPEPPEPRIGPIDVWKVTATGEQLRGYGVPGSDQANLTPPPKIVFEQLWQDKSQQRFSTYVFWAD